MSEDDANKSLLNPKNSSLRCDQLSLSSRVHFCSWMPSVSEGANVRWLNIKSYHWLWPTVWMQIKTQIKKIQTKRALGIGLSLSNCQTTCKILQHLHFSWIRPHQCHSEMRLELAEKQGWCSQSRPPDHTPSSLHWLSILTAVQKNLWLFLSLEEVQMVYSWSTASQS